MKIAVLSDKAFCFTPSMLMDIDEMSGGCELLYRPADSVTAAQLADAEIIFGCPPLELLRSAVCLKWHHLPNAAIQPYTSLSLYADTDVILTNSSGVYGAPISEHIIAMVFALARCFPLYSKQQRERIWVRDDDAAVSVDGSTIAVFGMGDLGKSAAAKLKALGAYIIGVRRSLLEKPAFVDEMFDLRSIEAVTERADFIVCCLPLTNATRGLFTERIFSLMKPSAYFINVGRGAIIDTNALVKTLESGAIAGAALDVTDPEPLPREHVLWDMDNVIITPHASCVADNIQERKLTLFLELLDRYKNGRRLKNMVNFLQGY